MQGRKRSPTDRRARLSDPADARWLQARTPIFSVDTALARFDGLELLDGEGQVLH